MRLIVVMREAHATSMALCSTKVFQTHIPYAQSFAMLGNLKLKGLSESLRGISSERNPTSWIARGHTPTDL